MAHEFNQHLNHIFQLIHYEECIFCSVFLIQTQCFYYLGVFFELRMEKLKKKNPKSESEYHRWMSQFNNCSIFSRYRRFSLVQNAGEMLFLCCSFEFWWQNELKCSRRPWLALVLIEWPWNFSEKTGQTCLFSEKSRTKKMENRTENRIKIVGFLSIYWCEMFDMELIHIRNRCLS